MRKLALPTKLVPFLVVLFALVRSGTAFGYCRATTCDPSEGCGEDEHLCATVGEPLQWKDGDVELVVDESGSVLRGLSGRDIQRAIEGALSVWMDADCGDGMHPSLTANTELASGLTAGFEERGANQSAILCVDGRWPYEAGAVAKTLLGFSLDSGDLLDADMVINSSDFDLAVDPSTNQEIDLTAVLTHEVGHVLGLGHSDVADATMKRETKGFATAALKSLEPDDMRGICAIYPPQQGGTRPTSSGTGDGADGAASGTSSGCAVSGKKAPSRGRQRSPCSRSRAWVAGVCVDTAALSEQQCDEMVRPRRTRRTDSNREVSSATNTKNAVAPSIEMRYLRRLESVRASLTRRACTATKACPRRGHTMRLHSLLALLTAVMSLVSCKEKQEAAPPAPSSQSEVKLPPPAPSVPAPADVATPPADAQRTPSGVAMKVIEPGTGSSHPDADRVLKMSYVGWRKDGVMFDQSPPLELTFRQLTPGWAEGVSYMVEGEKRRIWIPAALAFGDDPKPGMPKGDLTIDVKLLSIGRRTVRADKPVALAPIPAPEDVAGPPKDAKKTKSGLRYRIITPAKGASPKAVDSVAVHYTGWTADGKMFDSSIARGKPATFPLDHVIRGWTEGVQLMHVGEKARFWIPAALAYGDKPESPGAPSGPLVFDIELVSVENPAAAEAPKAGLAPVSGSRPMQ